MGLAPLRFYVELIEIIAPEAWSFCGLDKITGLVYCDCTVAQHARSLSFWLGRASDGQTPLLLPPEAVFGVNLFSPMSMCVPRLQPAPVEHGSIWSLGGPLLRQTVVLMDAAEQRIGLAKPRFVALNDAVSAVLSEQQKSGLPSNVPSRADGAATSAAALSMNDA